jgi:hypothetical protein
MIEKGFLEIFQVVKKALHMGAGGYENPALNEVVAVLQGEFKQAAGVRAYKARKIVVRDLGAGDPGGLESYREKPVRHQKGFGYERAGIADGYASVINCMLYQTVLRAFKELIKLL